MFVARKETRRDLVLNVMKYVTTLSVGGLDVTRENHGGVKLLLTKGGSLMRGEVD